MPDTELPGLDLSALSAYLDKAAPGLLGDNLTGEVIAGGKSNLTYVVSDGAKDVVVRRPPLGHVLATAHDMNREHRVMAALFDTPVPVPQMFANCTDDSVIGAPFYVMEKVTGTPYRYAKELEPLGPQRTERISDALVDTLVALHAVDPAAAGLSDFGKPDGYLQRQVHTWHRQMAGSKSRDLKGEQELHELLAAKIPDHSDASIVHGDYRLDNVLIDDNDTITAVLDWEMATLGDPLSDVALLLVYQSLARVLRYAVSDVSLAPGHPSREQIIERYSQASGRDVQHLNFHVALAYHKLAAILEGIYFRHSKGQTVGGGFDSIGEATEPLLELGIAAINQN